MPKADRIEVLRAKLIELEVRAGKLRAESNSICAMVPGPDGQPITELSDRPRFIAIGEELAAIRVQREAISAALAEVHRLIGEGNLSDIESESRSMWAKAERLRADFFGKFKVIAIKRPGGWATPSEAMQTAEYATLAKEYEPEIQSYEARAREAHELAREVSALIAGL